MARMQAAREARTGGEAIRAGARSRRELLRLGGGGAVAGALLTGGMRTPQAVAADTPALVGSWYVIRATPIDNTPGASPLTHWTMTFMADGTLTAQVAPVGLSLAGVTTVGSVASGVWGQLAGAGTFGFTHLHVRSDSQTGQAYGLPRWLGTITLDPGGDSFAISYREEILNLDTLTVDRTLEQVDGKGMRIALDPNLHLILGQPLQ
jgi:hypothetical protein